VSDIVERLRRISGGSAVVEVTQEAAAEIERLRAAGDALAEVADEWPELVEAWQEARRGNRYFQTIQSCPKAPCQHSSDRDTDIANLTADLAAERAEVAQLRGWHSEMLQYAAGRDAVITRLSAEVERLRAEAGETEAHVHYLLDSYHLWSEDGVFAMPDGWVYSQEGGPS
jgi:hypothetical protein